MTSTSTASVLVLCALIVNITLVIAPGFPIAKYLGPRVVQSTEKPLNAELPAPDDEEYAIYSAAIKEAYGIRAETKESTSEPGKDSGGKIGLVVIRDRTVLSNVEMKDRNSRIAQWAMDGVNVDAHTIDDFESRNKQRAQLESRFSLPVRYTLITNQDHDRIFKPRDLWQDWRDFYNAYPNSGGFVSFSRPGVNAKHDQALLYLEHACGSLCGTGHYVLLVKSNGEWKVKHKEMLWIS